MPAKIIKKYLLAATYLFVTVCGKLGGKFLVFQMVQPPSDIRMLVKTEWKGTEQYLDSKTACIFAWVAQERKSGQMIVLEWRHTFIRGSRSRSRLREHLSRAP